MAQSYLPESAEPIEIQGSTVSFYRFQEGNITYYQFDTSLVSPPDPFINAMCGLALIKNDQIKLIMINHKKPMGLIDRVAGQFEIETIRLEKDLYKLTFSFKGEISLQADLSAKTCH